MATNAPGIMAKGMGRSLTYGRGTSDIISLNLARKGGSPESRARAASVLFMSETRQVPVSQLFW